VSHSRRAVGRWRAAVAGVVLAVSPLAVAACGDSGEDSGPVQQVDEDEPAEDESGDDSSGGNENEPDEDEPDEDEPDEG
jgi:hypothetical protein